RGRPDWRLQVSAQSFLPAQPPSRGGCNRFRRVRATFCNSAHGTASIACGILGRWDWRVLAWRFLSEATASAAPGFRRVLLRAVKGSVLFYGLGKGMNLVRFRPRSDMPHNLRRAATWRFLGKKPSEGKAEDRINNPALGSYSANL